MNTALAAGLETTAADGLIDLAATLSLASKPTESWKQLERARDLADKREASRTSARAAVQMASWKLDESDAAGAIALLDRPLAFFKERHYTKYELTALSIAARAYQQLDDIPRAHLLASKVLTLAEATNSDIEIGIALNTLAAQSTALGALPEALTLRRRAEDLHRRQNDVATPPYDLTNRAELLIRLNHIPEETAALDEVDAGIAKNIDGYVGRTQRVLFLRTLAALVRLRFDDANRLLSLMTLDPNGTDTVALIGPALRLYCRVRRGRIASIVLPDESKRLRPVPPAIWRERQYWLAESALHTRDATQALKLASDGLAQSARIGNDELTWRLAAVASVAALRLNKTDEHQKLLMTSRAALDRLRQSWGTMFDAYGNRPDLLQLRKIAAL